LDYDSKTLVNSELQRHMLIAFTLALAGGIVAAAYGWTRVPDFMGFIWLLAGIVLAGLSIPLWSAQEWARVSVGSLAGAVAVAHIVVESKWGDLGREFGASIASVTYAGYFLVPSMRHTLAEAREAAERKRRARIREERQPADRT
jgi:hypothetical protein